MNLFEHAHWLWNTRYNQCENRYLDFYETFHADTLASAYTFYISADSDYAVYVNGTLAAFGQWRDYETYKTYDEADLTPYLKEGDNEIKITVLSIGRNFSTYRKQEQPGIIYELYADQRLFIISSSDTQTALNPCFTSGPVDIVTGQLGFSYQYDATKEGQKPELRRAEIVEKTKALYPRPIEKLSVGENLSARLLAQGIFMDCKLEHLSMGQRMQHAYLSARHSTSLTGRGGDILLPSEDGLLCSAEKLDSAADGMYFLLDFGKEQTGVFSLDIDLPHDTEILIGYGEHLDDLRVRSFIGRNFAFRYKGHAGRNTFTGPFLRLGLRYLQLHIYTDRCKLYYAGIRPTVYPLDHTPYFHCADHLHNKIYEVCVRTLEMCMHEHYEDCPWREQSLYSMDSRNQMLCGYYTFGETRFAKASLRLMALSLREDGMLELCSPAVVAITIPSFTAIFITQLEEYLRYSGDLAFIREMMPTARAIITAFVRQLDNPEKLLRCYAEAKYWNFYEWQEGLEGSISGSVSEENRTYDAPMNAFFSMALRAMAKLEDACGNADAAAICRRDKEALDERINHLFWDRDHQAYASYVNQNTGERFHYAELTNALIVYADAASEVKTDAVLKAITEKELIPVTISHSIFKYEALLRRPEKYGKWVFDDIAEIWGKMLYNNATTFYETEDGAQAFGQAGSLCHGWSAIPAYLYFAYVLGLKPTENGYASYEIQPVSSGIYDAQGLAVTPAGKISL